MLDLTDLCTCAGTQVKHREPLVATPVDHFLFRQPADHAGYCSLRHRFQLVDELVQPGSIETDDSVVDNQWVGGHYLAFLDGSGSNTSRMTWQSSCRVPFCAISSK